VFSATASSYQLATAIPVISTVKASAVLYSKPMLPVRDVLKTSCRALVSTRPNPTVIGPTPTAANPDVTRSGADWNGLHDRRGHRRLANWRRSHDHRRRSHHDQRRKWDSELSLQRFVTYIIQLRRVRDETVLNDFKTFLRAIWTRF
jgi:hypothetical protein